ncbi:hypothetical protein DSO57_1028454 [Entomophthora muscae]|uniref:Uncharacterized protein n=1 Tax=Entomophthora muscae TaxID=34485 RepID=A0ACC2T1N6_9FUNG|nr:hypothetical protein DSO57_1028454 [Entomophthora muscae]
MSSAPKNLRLSFKGDKKKKKKAKREDADELESGAVVPAKRYVEPEDNSTEGWRRVERIDELEGPLFFLINSDPIRSVAIEERALESIKTHPEEEDMDFDSCEPKRVQQVLIGMKVAGTSSMNIKTCHNTFLAADKIGKVTASRLAAGALEEWMPVIRDDGVGFQSTHGLFLAYDPITHQLRADSDTLGFNQVFVVKCQAKFKQAAKKRRLAREKEESGIGQRLDLDKELEITQAKKFQSWTSAYKPHHISRLDADKEKAKEALKDGKINEHFLERRAKTKSDRYCK